jgi:putative membrane protein
MAVFCAAFTTRGRRTSGRPRSFRAIARRCADPRAHPRSQSASVRPVSQVIVLLALLFAILIAVFAVQNTTVVAVQFLTVRAEAVAVSVLVLISAAFGAMAMLLLGVAREAGLRWRHRGVAQQLRAAQARIAELEAAQQPKPALQKAEAPTVASASPETETTPT